MTSYQGKNEWTPSNKVSLDRDHANELLYALDELIIRLDLYHDPDIFNTDSRYEIYSKLAQKTREVLKV